MKNEAAAALGKLGGSVKSERKAAAVRKNGAKAMGEIIGNHRASLIGDSIFFGQAKAIKTERENSK